ncbi:MAG: PLP-dependent aminotransferase family protein [Bacillota bacterium]
MFENLLSENAKEMRSSEIREFFELTEKPEVISFAGGFPNKECLPTEEVREMTDRLLTEAEEEMLQYSPTEGQECLRKYIAKFMQDKGVDVDYENILVTSGSQQGLDLVSKIFLDPGDKVITESPSYVGGLGAIKNYRGDVLAIKVDRKGMRLDLLEEKLEELSARDEQVKFIYLVADFNNPTGLSLATERRQKLVELAQEYGFLIIEDDPYSKLSYSGFEKPPIKAFDNSGHVLYLGSFSKIFIPGVRVGWVVADKKIIQKLSLAKQATDLCSNSMGQRLIAACGEEGIIDRQIKKLQKIYRQRRDVILDSLNKYFPAEVSWTKPEGGFYIWVDLPEGINSKELLYKAIDENVAYVTGSAFHIDNGGENSFRLSFSQPNIDEIEEGIKRLGWLIDQELESHAIRSQRCIK